MPGKDTRDKRENLTHTSLLNTVNKHISPGLAHLTPDEGLRSEVSGSVCRFYMETMANFRGMKKSINGL
ncbi:hypothetical protein XELAEV_18035839mg [Xenopus laevis]|uniref:Uncharacterized protein n=1 Tax=Xenopus laevis TaxID=8355 RepID=A0A974HCG3_XENLA|nr:hypothetical protein XELAEV_18035839mg [Xenopus laevis]